VPYPNADPPATVIEAPRAASTWIDIVNVTGEFRDWDAEPQRCG
jgi:hypothetical protein